MYQMTKWKNGVQYGSTTYFESNYPHFGDDPNSIVQIMKKKTRNQIPNKSSKETSSSKQDIAVAVAADIAAAVLAVVFEIDTLYVVKIDIAQAAKVQMIEVANGNPYA